MIKMDHEADVSSSSAAPPPYESIVKEPPVEMTVVQQPTSTVNPLIPVKKMGRNPEIALCPHCNIHIQTRIEPRATNRTHVIAIIFCAVGLWPCAFMSYACNYCVDVDHFCPNPYCNSYIGTYVN